MSLDSGSVLDNHLLPLLLGKDIQLLLLLHLPVVVSQHSFGTSLKETDTARGKSESLQQKSSCTFLVCTILLGYLCEEKIVIMYNNGMGWYNVS